MKKVYLDKGKKHLAQFFPHDGKWHWFTRREATGIYSCDRPSFNSLDELKAAFKKAA